VDGGSTVYGATVTRFTATLAVACLVGCNHSSGGGAGGGSGGATGASASATTGNAVAPAADTATTGQVKECDDYWNKVEECLVAKADKEGKTEKDRAEGRAEVHQSMTMLRSTSSGGKDRGGRMALAGMCSKWSATISPDTCMSTLLTPGH
jgi:hypothetical protein